MRVAVADPLFLFQEEEECIYGYAFEYIRRYKPCFLLTSWAEGFHYRRRLYQLGLNPFAFAFCYTARSLQLQGVDLLISFESQVMQVATTSGGKQGGRPTCSARGPFFLSSPLHQPRPLQERLRALQAFPGYKVIQIASQEQLSSLCSPKASVDTLITPSLYNITPSLSYRDALLLPQGYRPRFAMRRAFLTRARRCLIPTSHNLPWIEELTQAFHARYGELEHLLSLQERALTSPQQLNDVMLFAHDPHSLLHGDPLLFEAMAAGVVPVAPHHPVYEALGFVGGKQCIFFRPDSVDDFLYQINKALANPQKLAEMAREATAWIHTHFSKEALAQKLEESLQKQIKRKQRRMQVA